MDFKDTIKNLNIENDITKLEHTSLYQYIENISFPIYICDINTYEILYLNKTAVELFAKDDVLIGRKCYECLMHRDIPCELCNNSNGIENDFKSFNIKLPLDGMIYKTQGQFIEWNGQKAFINCILKYSSVSDSQPNTTQDDWSETPTEITTDSVHQKYISTWSHQLVTMLNNIPSGIAVIKLDRKNISDTVRTVYYNDRFFSFSGYNRNDYDAMLKNNEMAFVYESDIPALLNDTENICNGDIGTSAGSVVRCLTKDGVFRWMQLTGQLAERNGDICTLNIVLSDITQKKEAMDRQIINDELFRIAADTDERILVIFDVKHNKCRIESHRLFSAKFAETIDNIPQSLIDRGIIASDSVDTLCSMFTRIRNGDKTVSVSLQLCVATNKYEWFECNTSTILDHNGNPDHAVLVFHNITEQRVKEAVFKKWQQSIDMRAPESFTLFRCNLSRDASLDQQDGKLLSISFPEDAMSFNSRTMLYAEEFVCPDDRNEYIKLLNSDYLLSMFYRGNHFITFDYREISLNEETSWRRLTIELVEYPNSTDVQAFLMYEDIDEDKRAEIATMELAELDPLTGAYNRNVFAQKVEQLIDTNPTTTCALIILDLDCFKQLNDRFGHAAGDQALQDVVSVLSSFSRTGDLVGRLGGDEFLIWLNDVPYNAVISKIIRQMCENIQKPYSQDIRLSASAGIAVFPRDGSNYYELYQNADKALYKIKRSEKGSFSFYSIVEEEQSSDIKDAVSTSVKNRHVLRGSKRRMLIVDDNETSRTMLKRIFEDDYIVETAKNGADATISLRHFGISLSVVLLNLMLPGIDGFTILRRIQSDVDLRTIPVIVVTGDDEHSTLLKAFELGAAEYVVKPIDTDIVRMRVKSVISKAENERLRAQNSYLMLQRDEEAKYRTVLESTGTVVIEYNWRSHIFIYDFNISDHIAGDYNHRSLWQVFLSDMIADSNDVKDLQDTFLSLSNNKEQTQGTRLIKLKTPEGIKCWFRVNIYKKTDDFGLAEKLIITFNNVHNEILANNRLLFQATRDSLTGLYNRSGFLEEATTLIASKEPGYYVMTCIDIEKFNVINDQYGTDIGDKVLQHIADTIENFTKAHNGLASRFMADKFAVLYPAILQNTHEITQNQVKASTPDCILQPIRLRIGRCLVDDPSLSASTLFDRAAMAETLLKGRYDTHIINYTDSMRNEILKEQSIVSDMVRALYNGEFEPWFQPQYNHSTGALIGAEALVRWCKDGKIISPSEFIPIFERNGFIYEVDKSIWRQVCSLLRHWIDEGKNPPPISVNISRHDMLQADCIDVIANLLSEYRLPTDLFRLEITESAFSADTSIIKDIAGRLISAGFTVEIDDFGSGYSSLNTLKDVPASIVKLDMRFFELTEDSARGGHIIEAIVRMMKWLNMSIIAEGVEDKEQADYLKSIGCYYIQGFYYSKPLPLSEYEVKMNDSFMEHKPVHFKKLNNQLSRLFWDPNSLETFVFNNYIGGACVFELNCGKTELLRVNEQYYAELGSLVSTDTSLDDAGIWQFLSGEEREKAIDILHRMIEGNHMESAELYLTNGTDREFVHMTGRVIASVEKRYLFYSVIKNITNEKEIYYEKHY